MTSEDPEYRILSERRRVVSQKELTATGDAQVEAQPNATGELASLELAECDSVQLRGAIPAEVYSLSTFSEAMGHHWWNAAKLFVSRLSSEESDSSDDHESEPSSAPLDHDYLQTMVDSAGKAAQHFHDVWERSG